MIKRDFRIGDPVTCNNCGIGKVVDIYKENHLFSVEVEFEIGKRSVYTKDGKRNLEWKRSLFIIPKKKPTLLEVKAKYKELLESVKEVDFVFKSDNFHTVMYFADGKYNFSTEIALEHFNFNRKYMYEEDAYMIVKKMNEFVATEI